MNDLCFKCSRTVLQKQLCQINQTVRMLLLINLFSFLIKIRWTNILGNQFSRDNQFSSLLFDGLKLIYWICHNIIKNKHEEFIVQQIVECSILLWAIYEVLHMGRKRKKRRCASRYGFLFMQRYLAFLYNPFRLCKSIFSVSRSTKRLDKLKYPLD